MELDVIAGPDELMEGVGYKLALPRPRRDKLADFRVLVIDKHPLCPTAASIKDALNRLADHLAKVGCRVLRESPKLPDLARTTRIYVELLAAVYSLDLSLDDRARIDAAARVVSPEDQSLAAYRLRGITANHAEWIRATRVRTTLRGQWLNLFQEVDVVLCPRRRCRTAEPRMACRSVFRSSADTSRTAQRLPLPASSSRSSVDLQHPRFRTPVIQPGA